MVEPTGECWCGCGSDTGDRFWARGHDVKALYAALELLVGYGGKGVVTAGFLEANDLQPSGGRCDELREMVLAKYGS